MQNNEWLIHLTELRKRLIVITVWFVLMLCAGLYASPHILLMFKEQPAAAMVQWNVFSFTDGLFVYMKCALLFAILFTLPVLFYNLWAFVKPGLTEKEAKGTLAYVPASSLLFLSGSAFGYYVVFPMMLKFMMKLNQSIGAVETYGIDRYFALLFHVVLPLGIAFEMPIVVLFLTRLGLLTQERLRKTRKYAYLALTIVGTCISPPDFVSHLSVTIPLILLYEISAVVSGLYNRKLASMNSNPNPITE